MERSHYVLRKYSKASLDTDSVTVSLFVIFCDEATHQENPIYNLMMRRVSSRLVYDNMLMMLDNLLMMVIPREVKSKANGVSAALEKHSPTKLELSWNFFSPPPGIEPGSPWLAATPSSH